MVQKLDLEVASPAGAADAHNGAIDRAAEKPMYDQLRQLIVNLISQQQLVPGDVLPSEHQLCHDFGISRTVVRQALAQLENEGVIERVKGKGTFVAPPKISERLAHTLVGLYEDVKRRGGEVRSLVLQHRVDAADVEVAQALEIAVGDPVVVLERLRFVNGEPWSLSTTWMPESIGRLTFSHDMTADSLYQVLEQYGIVAVSGLRSAEAVVASRELAQRFGLAVGSALLKLRSIRRDAGDRPIEFFVAYHRGDRSRFEFELGPNESVARVVTHDLSH